MSEKNTQSPHPAEENRVKRSAAPAAGRSAAPTGKKGAAPAGKKPARGKKKSSGGFADVISKIGRGLRSILAAVGRGLSVLNHKLDRFRRDDVSAVIVNALVGGTAVVLVMCLLMIFRPGIDGMRAKSAANRGDTLTAVRLVRTLERRDRNPEKLDDVRVPVVRGFIRSGEFDAADAMIPDVTDETVRLSLERECAYERADTDYENGKYTEAAQRFYQLNDYSDSRERYADCRCALAVIAYLDGDETSARTLLLDVPDVVARVENAIGRVTEDPAEIQRIRSAELFSESALNHLEETMSGLREARSERPRGKIAAGFTHTVGITPQGTVLFTGDNMYGQCNVTEWTGVTQLAAGAYHTVALLKDGTVRACGLNTFHQTEVSEWTDIVAIAASAYDTVGLRSDGTVVACGLHSADVSGWHDVTFVTGGSYSMGCLYGNGMMMSTHAGAQMEMGAVLYDLSVCGPVSVGVLYDGTMVSGSEFAPEWTEMVSVVACETGILGIDVNGGIRSHFYRESDRVDVTVPGKAIEIVSSGTHHVVLTEDGRVHAFGRNDFGQCNVSDWLL